MFRFMVDVHNQNIFNLSAIAREGVERFLVVADQPQQGDRRVQTGLGMLGQYSVCKTISRIQSDTT